MLVLLDRDGVINRDTPTGVLTRDEFVLLPGAVEAIAKLSCVGYRIAICTNQSAIGKGLTTQAIVDETHAFLTAEVKKHGGTIDRIYIAPDHPDAPSPRRKPAPGMLLEALHDFHADPAQTPLVGDALRDLEAAAAAGCPRILTRTGKGTALEAAGIPTSMKPVHICDHLSAAADYILKTFPIRA